MTKQNKMNKNQFLILALIIFAFSYSVAQSNTDIYIADINLTADGPGITNIKNITEDHSGYDNQPYFIPRSSKLLFSSIRENDQSDIYEYDLNTAVLKQITSTSTSEFSPTPLKAGRFSTVRVEEDGTQRIWEINAKNNREMLLMPNVKAIGYHCWLNAKRLALFIVGKPHELHIASKPENRSEKVAENIGSALQKLDKYSVAYMDFTDSTACKIQRYNYKTGQISNICPCIQGSEYFAVTNNGNILSGSGKKLFLFSLEKQKWELFADLSNTADLDFYRLALNKKNDKIALVSRN